MSVTNPFQVDDEAKRYHTFRTRYHQLPFNLIRDFIGHEFESSLDVACGTGHSTQALAQISKVTVGVDISESMLKEARSRMNLEFVNAPAENLPFNDDFFDFVNISMAYHWVDQEKFLMETKRALKPGGFLAVDNYGFLGTISENPVLQKAHQDFVKENLPTASRQASYPTDDMVAKTGLKLIHEFKYDHTVAMNSVQFTNLLMTWSNFQILSDEQKNITAQKMRPVYDTIFQGHSSNLEFGGKTLLFQF